MAIVFVVVFMAFVLGIVIYNTCGEVYSCFDHYGWEEISAPDKKATIQNITQEQVQYTRNKAKFKTKISFSDGFYFITYKTDRDYRILTYKIFISDELGKKIMDLAIEKHKLAVEEFKNNNQSVISNVRTVNAKTTKDMTQIKIEIVNDERYIKSDNRIEYLSAIQKQAVSELNKLNNVLKIENAKLKDIPVDIAKYIKPKDISSLKNDIQKLENKRLVIDELIESEIKDKARKANYKKLTEKPDVPTQSNKDANVTAVSISDVKVNQEEEAEYGWEDWD
ncbi:hypothetical protein HDR61_04040 [bacterium]|nr:hypothetical protein [bacterium]